MLDCRVTVAIRVAIHFGKCVTSFVSLVFVLLKKEAYYNSDPKFVEKHNADLGRKLVRMYMIFFKLRRRAMKFAGKIYPEAREPGKNIPLKRLITRMEEVAGKLDAVLYDNPIRLSYVLDCETLSQYAISRWRGRPYSPPMIELDYFGRAFQMLEEEALASQPKTMTQLR